MSIIASIRMQAQAGNISYTGHATQRMISRNITSETVERILSANDNQIVDIQSPSKKVGKEHTDSRYLVYSPNNEDVIVVSLLLSQPKPEVRVVTVEQVDDDIWDRNKGGNPAIKRK